MARLRRSHCDIPGIVRKRRGRGFAYFDGASSERINDADMLQRIRDLAIPPAWKDVWICPYPNGHLQAVGIDAAGRRQYRYHDLWRQRRDAAKFDRMLDFAACLPDLRARCAQLLASQKLDREPVLACAVRLLDYGFFRIGMEAYAEEHATYGLATIRKEHVSAQDGNVIFDYPAKGGKQRIVSVVDPAVSEIVQRLKRRRHGGPELLAYRNGREWRDVSSRDINAFIKQQCGQEFSAKDFRTWNATVLAAVALAVSGAAATSKTARKRAITRATQEVAGYLGNTPAVARASYIDPRVFDRYRSGWTIGGVLSELGAELGQPSIQGRVEEAVLDLLTERTESDDLERVPIDCPSPEGVG
jgi:DNA topoisomerase I